MFAAPPPLRLAVPAASIRPRPLHFAAPACHSRRVALPSLLQCRAQLRTAVLVSGGGRSLENLLCHFTSSTLVQICLVIASREGCGAIERARRFLVPVRVISPRSPVDVRAFSEAVSAELDAQRVQLVVLAGFIHFYHIPDRYANRVMNIHPALMPSFCGRGYYGERVHRAVLAYGAKVTGVTVHFADNEYDHGPIILQRAVAVHEDDTVETLAARVFAEECRLLPQAIELWATQRLRIEGRRVRILPAAESTHAPSSATTAMGDA
ncbi:hypothetical protein CDCA_CDCA12G3502 [Cyanidium caldarium]|uniref:phosphoribosylglycinamide formyltransferase 1 n=1 Tax=Cyanidium caldarium TaxID=2771 RepID=A0AAV9IYW0_CYACA|nr:hypothetical protein CDCA_CDCA12G3502 [Cyanidium caldarium]